MCGETLDGIIPCDGGRGIICGSSAHQQFWVQQRKLVSQRGHVFFRTELPELNIFSILHSPQCQSLYNNIRQSLIGVAFAEIEV